jgi:hypothetical protein
MKLRTIFAALAVAFVLAFAAAQDANAGLFNRGCGCNSCCEPTCCAPEPTCCAPAAPTCCAPEPTCCAPAPSCCNPCCKPSLCQRLHAKLHSMCHRNKCCKPSCCEPTCCTPEPSCCAPAPTCGCGH